MADWIESIRALRGDLVPGTRAQEHREARDDAWLVQLNAPAVEEDVGEEGPAQRARRGGGRPAEASRLPYRIHESIELGRQLQSYRLRFGEKHWLSACCHDRHPALQGAALRKLRKRLSAIRIRAAAGRLRHAARTCEKHPHKLSRRLFRRGKRGGLLGRPVKQPVLWTELWNYFVLPLDARSSSPRVKPPSHCFRCSRETPSFRISK